MPLSKALGSHMKSRIEKCIRYCFPAGTPRERTRIDMPQIHLIAIALVSILLGCSSADLRPGEDTSDSATGVVSHQSSIGMNIDHYLSGMEALGFSGAIIVTHRGEVVLREGYGLADREARRPYTPTTIQSCGSITKQMTGAAILLLESQGKLSVDDPIDLYFDDLPEDRQAITIHQLLTHSSGLPGSVGPDEEPIGARAYLDRLMAEPLQFSPGSGYGYSNAGYSLLGMIVERVSGQSYEAFLRDKLLLPAGLTETGYLLPAWDRDRLAVGYRNGERWGAVYERGWLEDGPGWHLRANGGLHTTVDDMHRWLNTVRDRLAVGYRNGERWGTVYERGWLEDGPMLVTRASPNGPKPRPRPPWHVAMKPGTRKALPDNPMGRILRELELLKAQVRAKVEHPFHVIKNRFGYKKVRYRGLAKNTAQLYSLFALANVVMAAGRSPPSCRTGAS